MLIPIQYLFYKMYLICKMLDLDNPAFKAVIYIYVFSGLWILAILRFLALIGIMGIINADKYILLIILIPYGLSFLYFFYKKRYTKMIDKFKKESKILSILGWVIFGVFTLGGFLFFILTTATPLSIQ